MQSRWTSLAFLAAEIGLITTAAMFGGPAWTGMTVLALLAEVAAGSLSGGNQQKLVLAKWLLRDCRALLLDEPTRGIDVTARYEIYRLINEFVARGLAILMVSSDLPELLGMADRMLVMHNGRIVSERPNTPELTQQQLLRDAFGSP